MLYGIILYRPVSIPFTPVRFPMPGAPGDSSGELPGHFPIYQQEPGKKGAGLSGQLIAGHMGQAKSQWAAGEGVAMLSFQQTVHAQQRPDPTLVSSPASSVISQHRSGTKEPGTPAPR